MSLLENPNALLIRFSEEYKKISFGSIDQKLGN